MKAKISFDKNLREIPSEEIHMDIKVMEIELVDVRDINKLVCLLGELAVCYRIIMQLDKAEALLEEALQIIAAHKLGIKAEVQQKLRLGHVLQWKSDFNRSNQLFSEVVSLCKEDSEAKTYLDFALQHSGKNFFDQKRFPEAKAAFEEALALRIKQNASPELIASSEDALNIAMLHLRQKLTLV